MHSQPQPASSSQVAHPNPSIDTSYPNTGLGTSYLNTGLDTSYPNNLGSGQPVAKQPHLADPASVAAQHHMAYQALAASQAAGPSAPAMMTAQAPFASNPFNTNPFAQFSPAMFGQMQGSMMAGFNPFNQSMLNMQGSMINPSGQLGWGTAPATTASQ